MGGISALIRAHTAFKDTEPNGCRTCRIPFGIRLTFRGRFGGSFIRFRCRSGRRLDGSFIRCGSGRRFFCRRFFPRFVFHRRVAEFAHFYFLSVDFNFVQNFDICFMTDGALVSSVRRQRAQTRSSMIFRHT